MEALEDLENNIRTIGIKFIPIKQIASIRVGDKAPIAWDNLKRIGKKISNSWRLKEPSWEIISENRR